MRDYGPPIITPPLEPLHIYDCYDYLNQFAMVVVLYPSQVHDYELSTGYSLRDQGVWDGNVLTKGEQGKILDDYYCGLWAGGLDKAGFWETLLTWTIVTAIGVSFAVLLAGAIIAGEFAGLVATIGAISEGATSIAATLHLAIALDVHNLAYLLSGDYRNFWKKFYAKLSKVSKALGFDAYYLALVFRNSRTLIIDAATSMGFSYEASDLIFLDSFSKYLWKFSANAKTYAGNPEAIFFDLNEYLERSPSNVKSGFIRNELSATANIASVLDATVKDVILIRSDINTFVTDLPPAWSRKIEKLIAPIMKKFDNFVEHTYKPEMKRIWEFYGHFDVLETKNSDNIFQLFQRTDNPFKMLNDAWLKPIKEILGFEDKIIDLTAAPLSDNAAAIVEIAKPTVDELLAGAEREIITPVPVRLLNLEPDPPRPIFVPQAKIRETWFVGDY